jgi:CheY-like chemotaxis protein
MHVHLTTANQRVLIVEKDPAQLDMMITVLEHLGHVCYGASSPADAIASVDTLRPMVVLVDLDPFEEDAAVSLGLRLRLVAGSNVFVVAVLAWAAPDDDERTLRIGFDAHAIRPLTTETLRALMRDAALKQLRVRAN